MSYVVSVPKVQTLEHVHAVISKWQHDGTPVQLHPGDIGWFGLRGDEATAAALRVWADGEDIAAIALIDGPQLLRLAIDPDRFQDERLAARIAADVENPEAGVLDGGEAAVEARGASALGVRLESLGWAPDEPWTPLRFDLADPVDIELDGLRVTSVAPSDTAAWVRVHWSAFRGTPMPSNKLAAFVDGWVSVAASPLFGSACILALDHVDDGTVAVAAVWSAGGGRPGLVEPMGVHQDHRGRGYGRVVTRAAAAALREMGASSAIVCAESSNVGAVSTYVAAGFTAHPEVADWVRAE